MSEGQGSGWLAQRLATAREDARRIARELASRGHLDPEQAAALEEAVERAVDRGRGMLDAAVREPRRIIEALRRSAAGAPEGAAPASAGGRDAAERLDELAERVAALEERLDRLERAVPRRPRDDDASDGG